MPFQALREVTLGTFLILGLLALATPARAGYTFSSVPGPSGAAATGLNGMNDAAQIIGFYQGGSFLYGNGSSTPISDPSGSTGSTNVSGISNSGTVVGNYSDAQDNSHGFVLNGGGDTTLDDPGSTSFGSSGINTSGQIVGYNFTPAGFLYANGSFTPLQDPQPGTSKTKPGDQRRRHGRRVLRRYRNRRRLRLHRQRRPFHDAGRPAGRHGRGPGDVPDGD